MVASSTTKCRCWHSGSVVLDRVISYVCFCHCVFQKEVVVVRLQINLITVYTVINNHRIYVFMKIFVLVYQPLTIFLFFFFFFRLIGCSRQRLYFYSESKCDRNKMICIINKFIFQPLPDTFIYRNIIYTTIYTIFDWLLH